MLNNLTKLFIYLINQFQFYFIILLTHSIEKFQGNPFKVAAGDLSFSVALYTITAIIAIMILMARRYIGFLGKAELGGPIVIRWITFAILITMWLLYVLLSSLQAYGHITAPF